MPDEWQKQVDELIHQVKIWRENVLQTSTQMVEGLKFCHTLSDSLDNFVHQIYTLAFEMAMEKSGNYYIVGNSEVALIATGGYGRREFCPFSDLDLAFVPLQEDDPFIDCLLKECFRLIVTVFMDNTDLKVGYAYRPLSDLPILDTPTQASLLDGRFVAGYQPLAQELQNQLLKSLDVLRFIRDIDREREIAYHRYHNTPLVVEPNLKEGAGGLRDGHSAVWLLSALNHLSTHYAFQKLQDMLPQDEWEAFQNGLDFLLYVRNWLHLKAQRRQDTFLREYHYKIAIEWGKGQIEDEEKCTRSFHQQLYKSMEAVHKALLFARRAIKEATIPLIDGFVRQGQWLTIDTELNSGNAHRILKAFELMQKYDLEPSLDLLRWIIDHAVDVSKILTSPEAAQSFLTVLTGKGDAPFGKALRLMAQTGVLGVYMPEWDKASHYIPSNAAHRFTVGEHLFATVEELYRLRRRAKQGEFPWADVWANVNDEEVLFLSAFTHDLGKAISETNHENVSADLANCIGERLGFSEERLKLLVFLVRHHLILLSTARLRDIFAADTIRAVAETVGNELTLKMLLLHSFADAKSVSEQTFTEMEERVVLDLYFSALRNLRELVETKCNVSTQVLTTERIMELKQILKELTDQEMKLFCDAVPSGYLLSTPLQTIAIHCKMMQRVKQTGKPEVEVLTEPSSGFTEVFVCAQDDPKPGMLSKITGALFACDIDIREARVFTLPGEPNLVLDTLWVTTDGQPLSEAKTQRVRQALLSVTAGEITLTEFFRRQDKPITVPVQVRSVTMRNDVSETHTLIHIVARDRKGLLYRLTKNIADLGLDIKTAKISTWGDVAEDAFYVIRKGEGKVPDDSLDSLAKQLLERLSHP